MALTKKELENFRDQMPKGVKIVDGTEWLPEKEDKYAAWRFVEEFYPNYGSCDNIAWEQDLAKVIEGSWEEGDAAHETYLSIREYVVANNIGESEEAIEALIVEDAKASQTVYLKDIYEAAIEGFIEFMRSGHENI